MYLMRDAFQTDIIATVLNFKSDLTHSGSGFWRPMLPEPRLFCNMRLSTSKQLPAEPQFVVIYNKLM